MCTQLFWIVLTLLKFGEAREFSVLHARKLHSSLALALVNFQNATKHPGATTNEKRSANNHGSHVSRVSGLLLSAALTSPKVAV